MQAFNTQKHTLTSTVTDVHNRSCSHRHTFPLHNIHTLPHNTNIAPIGNMYIYTLPIHRHGIDINIQILPPHRHACTQHTHCCHTDTPVHMHIIHTTSQIHICMYTGTHYPHTDTPRLVHSTHTLPSCRKMYTKICTLPCHRHSYMYRVHTLSPQIHLCVYIHNTPYTYTT